MTDNSELNAQQKFKLETDGRSTDHHLEMLVSLANFNGLEFGITLAVQGIVVSGKLIGGKKYYKEFAESFSARYPSGSDLRVKIKEALEAKGDIYNSIDDDDTPAPQYIHLMEARYFTPSGNPMPQDGVLWRGKLNSVSGFSLGEFALATTS